MTTKRLTITTASIFFSATDLLQKGGECEILAGATKPAYYPEGKTDLASLHLRNLDWVHVVRADVRLPILNWQANNPVNGGPSGVGFQ